MMPPPPAAVALVLAAGRGERFGGGKLAAPLAGRPLFCWAVDTALRAAFCRVLVVLGKDAEALRALLPADPRLEVLVNPHWSQGMGTSLALAARAASQQDAAGLAVLLGDMPLVSPLALAAVAQAALSSPAGAAAATAAGRRGHPVAFAARHLAELGRLRADQGGRDLLARLGDDLAQVEVPPQSLLDVDRAEDLQRAAELLPGPPTRPGLDGLAAALGVDRPGLYAVVGSGGKTSLLAALTSELARQGQCVILTTSTHIHPPPAGLAEGPWLLGQDLPSLTELARRLRPGRPLCLAGRRLADGKLKGLTPAQLAALRALPGLWVLSEADGAAGRPLKGWAAHEPALCGCEDGLLVVAGASGLGRPLEERWVHRPRLYAPAAGLEPGEIVTPEALARVLGGEAGPLRGVAPGVPASLLLNQAESLAPASQARLCAALASQGRWRKIIRASLRLGWFHSCPPTSC